MSRALDRLPEPEPNARRKMKVIVVSASRTGTFGLYRALNSLGYRCYHVVEAMHRGPAHQKACSEAIVAANSRLSGHKRYTRPDFDRWLGEYDCILEMPSFVGTDMVEAYLGDPDVKFILTERDPDSWVRSMNNTVAQFEIGMNSFPMTVFRHFNDGIGSFATLGSLIYYRWSDGTKPGKGHNQEALRRNYVDYIQSIKAKIPADRLKIIKLEDGLDWPDFCPFLGHEIPKEPYPRGNDPAEFKTIVEEYFNPKVPMAMAKLGMTVLPVIGVGLWFALSNGNKAGSITSMLGKIRVW